MLLAAAFGLFWHVSTDTDHVLGSQQALCEGWLEHETSSPDRDLRFPSLGKSPSVLVPPAHQTLLACLDDPQPRTWQRRPYAILYSRLLLHG